MGAQFDLGKWKQQNSQGHRVLINSFLDAQSERDRE